MLDTIKKLTAVCSVSGRETKVREKIAEYISPLTDECEVDSLGNLIAVKKGSGENKKKIMLCAHMDEIGFMATYIEDSGFIRCANIGGINFVAAAFGKVVFENGVRGVIVPDAGTKPEDLKCEKFYVDIGAKDKKDAERKVKVGDCFVLESDITRLLGKRIAGRPLDDRIGCVALIEIAKKLSGVDVKDDIYFVFSVQEEVGCRGAKTAGFSVAPDYALIFDVTATGDAASSKPMEVKLGGGAAIKIKDASVICHTQVVEKLISLAKEKKIKAQNEILLVGGTDTSAVQMSGIGTRAGALSIPTRYIHSGVEMLDLGDLEACIDLAVAFIENI